MLWLTNKGTMLHLKARGRAETRDAENCYRIFAKQERTSIPWSRWWALTCP